MVISTKNQRGHLQKAQTTCDLAASAALKNNVEGFWAESGAQLY